jgi:transcriptional regulator with XRE-family HTH domain
MNYRLASPHDLAVLVANRARERRLRLRRSQADAASAAGVSLATFKRFEHGEDVGFDVVIKVALALGAEEQVAMLFSAPPAQRSIDEILEEQRLPQRVRRKSKQ